MRLKCLYLTEFLTHAIDNQQNLGLPVWDFTAKIN